MASAGRPRAFGSRSANRVGPGSGVATLNSWVGIVLLVPSSESPR